MRIEGMSRGEPVGLLRAPPAEDGRYDVLVADLKQLAPGFAGLGDVGAGGSTRRTPSISSSRSGANRAHRDGTHHLARVRDWPRRRAPRARRARTWWRCAAIRRRCRALRPGSGRPYANELVDVVRPRVALRRRGRLPRAAPGGAEREADLANLKRKVDAGAEFAQLFFDADDYTASSSGRAPPASACRSSRASCRW